MAKLTISQIKRLDRPGLYADGEVPTLYLNVATGGSKSWIQRIVIGGKRRDIGLGGWPVVPLTDARDIALDNRRAVRRGDDPLAAKRRAKVPTFREAAHAAFEANKGRRRSAKNEKAWLRQLERRAFNILGDMPVDRISREDVLRVLTPIWRDKPEAARKVRQRVTATLRWAEAYGHAQHNIAAEGIDGALPAMPAVKEHLRALPYREVGAALGTVDGSDSSLSAKLCFRFLVLTAARSGEARGTTWAEIDMDAREWRIPGERMKAGAEHRIPLSDAALAVLAQARTIRDADSDLVFPSPARAGRPLSDMTLTKVLRTAGLGDRATVHGFRSSFRDWAAEQSNAPHAVMELSLAHAVGSAVERAYARSDLLAKRRLLMVQWAEYIGVGATGEKVVALRR